jgi:hypothetical protein
LDSKIKKNSKLSFCKFDILIFIPWFSILKKHPDLLKKFANSKKDKILQEETVNFEKIYSEMPYTKAPSIGSIKVQK